MRTLENFDAVKVVGEQAGLHVGGEEDPIDADGGAAWGQRLMVHRADAADLERGLRAVGYGCLHTGKMHDNIFCPVSAVQGFTRNNSHALRQGARRFGLTGGGDDDHLEPVAALRVCGAPGPESGNGAHSENCGAQMHRPLPLQRAAECAKGAPKAISLLRKPADARARDASTMLACPTRVLLRGTGRELQDI